MCFLLNDSFDIVYNIMSDTVFKLCGINYPITNSVGYFAALNWL